MPNPKLSPEGEVIAAYGAATRGRIECRKQRCFLRNLHKLSWAHFLARLAKQGKASPDVGSSSRGDALARSRRKVSCHGRTSQWGTNAND
jgi:hypothetical protein